MMLDTTKTLVFVLSLFFVGMAREWSWLYQDHDSLMHMMQQYHEKYPNLTQLISIGKSVQSRELLVLKITSNVNKSDIRKPKVRLVGHMHGNEPVGRETLTYLFMNLLDNYGNDTETTWLLDHTDIYLLPSMNPDGFVVSRNSCEFSMTGRDNAFGVDLEKTFKVQNDKAVPPETQAVLNWIDTTDFVLSANLHSSILAVAYPYDENPKQLNIETTTEDDDVFRNLATSYVSHHSLMKTGYLCSENFGDPKTGIINGAAWYSIENTLADYSYTKTNCFELTIYPSCCKYPSIDQVKMDILHSLPAMKNLIQNAHLGFSGVVTDSSTHEALGGVKVGVMDRDHDIMTNSDGAYWRLLLPGTYQVKFSMQGFQDKVVEVMIEEPSDSTLNLALQVDIELDPVLATTVESTSTPPIPASSSMETIIGKDCVVVDPTTHQIFDFGPLKALSPFHVEDVSGIEYSISFCEPLETCGSTQTVGGCQKLLSGQEFSIGSASSQIEVQDNYLIMKYSNGDVCGGFVRQSKINFLCSTETKLTFLGEFQTCTYYFNMATPLACKQDDGVSTPSSQTPSEMSSSVFPANTKPTSTQIDQSTKQSIVTSSPTTVSLISPTMSASDDSDSFCVIKDETTGHSVDLSSLSGVTITSLTDVYAYEYSPCSPLQCGTGTDAFICQRRTTNPDLTRIIANDMTSSELNDDGTLALKYGNGAVCHDASLKRSAVVSVRCAPESIEPKLILIEETSDCEFVFELMTSLACIQENQTTAAPQSSSTPSTSATPSASSTPSSTSSTPSNGGDCTVVDPNTGRYFDLRPLKYQSPFDFNDKLEHNNYSISICKPIRHCGSTTNVGVCQDAYSGEEFSLGEYTSEIQISDGEPMITYNHGDLCGNFPRKTQITFKCQRFFPTRIKFPGEAEPCLYLFEVFTPFACGHGQSTPDNNSTQLSTRSMTTTSGRESPTTITPPSTRSMTSTSGRESPTTTSTPPSTRSLATKVSSTPTALTTTDAYVFSSLEDQSNSSNSSFMTTTLIIAISASVVTLSIVILIVVLLLLRRKSDEKNISTDAIIDFHNPAFGVIQQDV